MPYHAIPVLNVNEYMKLNKEPKTLLRIQPIILYWTHVTIKQHETRHSWKTKVTCSALKKEPRPTFCGEANFTLTTS